MLASKLALCVFILTAIKADGKDVQTHHIRGSVKDRELQLFGVIGGGAMNPETEPITNLFGPATGNTVQTGETLREKLQAEQDKNDNKDEDDDEDEDDEDEDDEDEDDEDDEDEDDEDDEDEDDEDDDEEDDDKDDEKALNVTAIAPDGSAPTCGASLGLLNGNLLKVNVRLAGEIDNPSLNFARAVYDSDAAGEEFLHVTYVVDTSASTSNACDATRTILDCEKQALVELNNRLIATNGGRSVSLVAFNDFATTQDLDLFTDGVQALGRPTDFGFVAVVDGLSSGGNTDFRGALQQAIATTQEAMLDPRVTRTLVVFLTDGRDGRNVDAETAMFQEMGTTVMSFAVGSESECDESLINLSTLTGGSCNRVEFADTLLDDASEIIFDDSFGLITSVVATLDGQTLPITSRRTLGETDTILAFTDSLITDHLTSHELCFQATAVGETVSCCVDYTVMNMKDSDLPDPKDEVALAVTEDGSQPVCSFVRTLSNGASLLTRIDLIGNINDALLEFGSVLLTGSGAQGQRYVHVTYVVDQSASTAAPCDSTRTILQCEKDALLRFNEQLVSTNAGVSVGLVPFSDSAVAADLSPTNSGVQVIASPNDVNVVAQINAITGGGLTNFRDALDVAAQVVLEAQKDPAVTESIVIFLTDGQDSASLATQTAALKAYGASVFSFAVGPTSMCSTELQTLGLETGGGCEQIIDAATLDDSIVDLVFNDLKLTSVKATLNDQEISVSTTPAVTAVGLDADDTPVAVLTNSIPIFDNAVYNLCLEASAQGETSSCCVDFTVQY